MKEIMLTIKGIQTSNGDSEEIEFITEGKLEKRNGKYHITYDESELSGVVGATTDIKIDGGQVTMSRSGDSPTHMVFEMGKHYMGQYATPAGAFSVGIFPNLVNVNMKDNKGEINVKYLLKLNDDYVSENDVRINYYEKGYENA